MELPINYEISHWTKRKLAREEYIKRQNGLCFYCGKPLDQKPAEKILNLKINRNLFPPNFFKHTIHLHHSHDTGMTVGAVHSYCNAVLWQYDEE